MKRLLLLLSALLLTAAFATQLPTSGTVNITNDNGVVIGSGIIDNGVLHLSVQTGVDGLVSLNFTQPDGSQAQVPAMISNDGNLTIMTATSLQDVQGFAAQSHLTADVQTVNKLATPDQNTADHASQQGQDAKQANATTPEQETQNSQADQHSQGNGQVNGDNSVSDHQGAGASNDTQDQPDQTHSSTDDSVNVGAKVGSSGTQVSGSVDSHTQTGSDSQDAPDSGSGSDD